MKVKLNTTKSNNSLARNIPHDWTIVELREICRIFDGTHTTPNYKEDGIPFYSVEHVTSNNFNDTKFISPDVFEKENLRVKIDKGDILMTRIGDIGTTKLIDWDVQASFYVSLALLKNKSKNNFNFINQFINSNNFKIELNKKIIHVAFPKKINLGDIGLCKIILPPLPEQTAIANLLSTWDKAIHLNTQLLEQKQKRKKWLMQMLLTGKKRLKGFEGEWEELHIRDVSEEVSIRNKENNQLTVLSCTKYDGLVPSLEYFGRKIFADDISTYKIVPKNNFAYATNHIEEGSIGYQNDFENALISPMYTVFKTNNLVEDSFFFRLLKSYPLIYQYQNRMEGSIDRRGGLRWDAFSIIKIKLPPLNEQQAIANILDIVDFENTVLQKKVDKLKEQKKGLMQILLTGKKRLKFD